MSKKTKIASKTVICPFCGTKYNDIDLEFYMVGNTKIYYCENYSCTEGEFVEGLKIKR